MDAFYLINPRNRQILIYKEYKENDNNNKLQIFLSEYKQLLQHEKSPYLLIKGTILVYYYAEDAELLYISFISEDVSNLK
jgi:hypothetical protein